MRSSAVAGAETGAADGALRFRALVTAPAPSSAEAGRGAGMPASLRDRYGSDLLVALRPDRPTVLANFVSTLDGVVAFDVDGSSGGGEVSGRFEPDRFVMGLLRTLADVVVVGAGTVRAAPGHRWTPAHVHRPSAAATAAWRHELGIVPVPTTVVVTARGDLPPDHPGLTDPSIPVVVLTTAASAAQVRALGLGAHASVRAGRQAGTVSPEDVIDLARDLGARVVLSEGGPNLLGQLLAAHLVDELFLTLAPQIAGRAPDRRRLALVEGTAFDVDTAPWAALRSVHAAGSHLFLRHALEAAGGGRP